VLLLSVRAVLAKLQQKKPYRKMLIFTKIRRYTFTPKKSSNLAETIKVTVQT